MCNSEKQLSRGQRLLQIICKDIPASAIIDAVMKQQSYLKITVKSKALKNQALRNNLFPLKTSGESTNWKWQHLTAYKMKSIKDQTLSHSKKRPLLLKHI